jgi:VCBS repeat-containing protein
MEITGTSGNDTITILSDTDSVQADAGTDIAVFSGNYADYTFSQSDSYVPLMTHNTSGQVVSLYGLEQLQFDDVSVNFITTGSGEFQVNTTSPNIPAYPSITALNDGGFVITWHTDGQDGDSNGVAGQIYDASGSNVGSEFLVNTTRASHQTQPSITALNDGDFVIAWQSYLQDGDGYGVYAQRYDASGTNVGSEFQVNTYTVSDQDETDITALNDGGFVITWRSKGQDGDDYGVYAQRYDASGTNVGSEFQVNTYNTSGHHNPATTALNDGGFVITWQSVGADTVWWDVYAQIYNASGASVGSEFLVNSYTTHDQYNPVITTLNDGGFVIAWESYGQDVDAARDWGVYVQIYDASGARVGDEFLVNTYTSSNHNYQSIAALNDGGFVIAWESNGVDGSDDGVYAQIYDASGNTVGTEFYVNAYTAGYWDMPSITTLDDGDFVITWNSSTGVYAQRYVLEGDTFTTDISSIHGGEGNDSILGTDSDDELWGGEGNDTINGGSGNDYLEGEVGVDVIDGEAGDDDIWGGEGNDTINGGSGNDYLDGEAGDDVIDGGDGDDSIYGDEGNDEIWGGEGNDFLNGEVGDDYLEGEVGNDEIKGEAGNDEIWGGEGNDTLNGGSGNDRLSGEAGHDVIDGGDGDDEILGGEGSDTIRGRSGDDVIDGGIGDDEIFGYAGNDDIWGGEGDDYIRGSSGNDYLDGEAGDDIITGDDDDDIIWGDSGNDWLYGGSGNDYINGEADDDDVEGGEGNDEIWGGEGNDYLYGEAGNDDILGGEGNDTLSGGSGFDWLDGGAGDDTYLVTDQWDYISDELGDNNVVISADFFKTPSTITQISYDAGVKLLPYWIDALTLDSTSATRYHIESTEKQYFYTYPVAPLDYYEAEDLIDWSAANDYIKEAFEYVTTALGKIIDVLFVSTDDPLQVNTITLSTNTQLDSSGYTYTPETSKGDYNHLSSDIFIDADYDQPSFTEPNYAIETLVHELGHAIGLKHTFDTGEYGQIGEGPFLESVFEDNTDWTMMSYTDGDSAYSANFAPLDIAALQYIYGVAADVNDGDSAYLFDDSQGVFVYDGQGVDVIDASSAQSAATIYLTEGDWSFIGEKSNLITSANQLTINFNTEIEGAIGGDFKDKLYGNLLDNNLQGGGGNDLLKGEVGNDYLYGQAGDDEIWGGEGNDFLNGEVGDDYLEGEAGGDEIWGGEGNDEIWGGDGDDYLEGEAGDDVIDGEAGDDDIWGGEGNDTLRGGSGNDYLDGIEGDDVIDGGDGDDAIWGDEGNDYLDGAAGDDEIYGEAGNDTLLGNAGDDTLTGGLGNDTMTGGAGSDQYVIKYSDLTDNSIDIITDFAVGVDGDVLDLRDIHIGNIEANPDYIVGEEIYPYSLGYVRFIKSGDDTVVAYDIDGHGIDYNPQAVAILQNVDSLKFVKENHAVAGQNFNISRNGVIAEISEDAQSITVELHLWGGQPSDDVTVIINLPDSDEDSFQLVFTPNELHQTKSVTFTKSTDFDEDSLGNLSTVLNSNDVNYDGESLIYMVKEELTLSVPPALSSAISDASTNEDAAYSYDASASFSDTDGDTLTYSATLANDSALPSWLSINSSTGVLSGTPANVDVGAIAVKVTATDVASASVSDTYTLTVSNTNDAAIITAADASITEDIATITGTATHTDIDANNDANVFKVTIDASSTYGAYSVTTGGAWTYTLDNTNATIQALGLGESTTDSITVTAEDGTTESITITINGANEAPVTNQVVVNAKSELITGTTLADLIESLGGTNAISANEGNDTITLASDSAWASGYVAKNVSNGESVGTQQTVKLDGLNRFSDVIDGGADVDTLVLTSGSDAFFLDDIYSAHHESVGLAETARGTDSAARIINLEAILGGLGDDLIDLTSNDFTVSNSVTLDGGEGNDILWSSIGNDILNGGTGDDTLFGGAGDDTLTGGTGKDTFQFTASSGNDIISDFTVSDQDILEFYYRSGNTSDISDLTLTDGVLNWATGDGGRVVQIDMSDTVSSSNINDYSDLVTFVEIA